MRRFLDRILNFFRGSRKPHRCSIHHREYNAEFFRDCPDCLAEAGPFHPKH